MYGCMEMCIRGCMDAWTVWMHPCMEEMDGCLDCTDPSMHVWRYGDRGGTHRAKLLCANLRRCCTPNTPSSSPGSNSNHLEATRK